MNWGMWGRKLASLMGKVFRAVGDAGPYTADVPIGRDDLGAPTQRAATECLPYDTTKGHHPLGPLVHRGLARRMA